VEGEISSYLQESFPRAFARLKIGFPDVREILGSIEIDLLEGGTYTPYYRKGHGLQRVLYLSLVRTLAKKIRQRTGQSENILDEALFGQHSADPPYMGMHLPGKARSRK
jgi:hypothetical protein